MTISPYLKNKNGTITQIFSRRGVVQYEELRAELGKGVTDEEMKDFIETAKGLHLEGSEEGQNDSRS